MKHLLFFSFCFVLTGCQLHDSNGENAKTLKQTVSKASTATVNITKKISEDTVNTVSKSAKTTITKSKNLINNINLKLKVFYIDHSTFADENQITCSCNCHQTEKNISATNKK